MKWLLFFPGLPYESGYKVATFFVRLWLSWDLNAKLYPKKLKLYPIYKFLLQNKVLFLFSGFYDLKVLPFCRDLLDKILLKLLYLKVLDFCGDCINCSSSCWFIWSELKECSHELLSPSELKITNHILKPLQVFKHFELRYHFAGLKSALSVTWFPK